jgi:arabinose-5-phosphate isomerase
MQPFEKVAIVSPDNNLRNVVIKMTEKPQGAALVLDKESLLLGIITEGDLRRSLAQKIDIDNSKAKEVMSRKPITIKINSFLSEVLTVMENRESQISVLPVVDDLKCVGLIRIHDIYQTQLL